MNRQLPYFRLSSPFAVPVVPVQHHPSSGQVHWLGRQLSSPRGPSPTRAPLGCWAPDSSEWVRPAGVPGQAFGDFEPGCARRRPSPTCTPPRPARPRHNPLPTPVIGLSFPSRLALAQQCIAGWVHIYFFELDLCSRGQLMNPTGPLFPFVFAFCCAHRPVQHHPSSGQVHWLGRQLSCPGGPSPTRAPLGCWAPDSSECVHTAGVPG